MYDGQDDLKRAAHELESDRTTLALLNATNDTALLIDASGTVLALNDTASMRLGKLAGRDPASQPDTYVGACVYELFPDGLAEQRRARNKDVVRRGRAARFEDERDGRWTDNAIYPILDETGRVTRLAIFSADVTERKLAEDTLRARAEQIERLNVSLASALDELKQSQEELRGKSRLLERALEDERDRARRDGLTGVLNHGAIMAVVRERVQSDEGERFALGMIDVDRMKAINDTYGHQVGDAALIHVASALNHGNAIVGRYGGDEFVVLLSAVNDHTVARFAEQVHERLSTTHVADPATGTLVPVVVSTGFATFPDDATSITELLAQSDVEMYAAKHRRPMARVSSRERHLTC